MASSIRMLLMWSYCWHRLDIDCWHLHGLEEHGHEFLKIGSTIRSLSMRIRGPDFELRLGPDVKHDDGHTNPANWTLITVSGPLLDTVEVEHVATGMDY